MMTLKDETDVRAACESDDSDGDTVVMTLGLLRLLQQKNDDRQSRLGAMRNAIEQLAASAAQTKTWANQLCERSR